MDQSPQPLYPQTDQTPPPAPNPAPEVPPHAPEQVPVPTHKPGRIISIIGLVFAFVFLAPVGLVLSIIGFIQSKKAGKADIIAILGLIFNILALAIVGVIAGLIIANFGKIQSTTGTIQHAIGATYITALASNYQEKSPTKLYPRLDRDGFIADVTSVDTDNQRINTGLLQPISTEHPSQSNQSPYFLAYCGADTQDKATGMSVEYWSARDNAVKTEVIGTGCDDGSASTDDTQSGTIEGSDPDGEELNN